MKSVFRFRASEIFYIRGYAKSGTTWLSNLMNLHPSITSKSEFHLCPLFDGLQGIQDFPWGLLRVEKNSRVLNEAFYRMIKHVIADVCDHQPLCGDKTPCSLRSTFVPGVKTLYITRDGRDGVVSWFYHAMNQKIDSRPEMQEKMRQFDNNRQYFEENKQDLLSFENLVREYASKWNETIVDDFKMMRAADRGEIDLPHLWIRYEDLQNDTMKYRDEAYRFLRISPAKAKPLTWLTEAGFGDEKRNQPEQFYRRGDAGTWREYFTSEQLDWFMEEAEEGLRLVGPT